MKQELCATWQIQAKGEVEEAACFKQEVEEAVSRAITAGMDHEAAS